MKKIGRDDLELIVALKLFETLCFCVFVSCDLKNKCFMVQWARTNARLFIFLCFYNMCLLLLLEIAKFAVKIPYFY